MINMLANTMSMVDVVAGKVADQKDIALIKATFTNYQLHIDSQDKRIASLEQDLQETRAFVADLARQRDDARVQNKRLESANEDLLNRLRAIECHDALNEVDCANLLREKIVKHFRNLEVGHQVISYKAYSEQSQVPLPATRALLPKLFKEEGFQVSHVGNANFCVQRYLDIPF